MKISRNSAVVIGSSFSGLLAARALSDHFANVTILEKDRINPLPESRNGQAQTRHLHGLLTAGLDTLEDYFPGIIHELVKEGAIYEDIGLAIKWYQCGGYKKQFKSGLKGVVQSRPLLEYLIRNRVQQLDNITINDGCTVTGLNIIDNYVTGVKYSFNTQESTIQSSLVVDASGRGSRLPLWLEDSGYDKPENEEVIIRLGYSTRIYEWSEDHLHDALLLASLAAPPEDERSGYLFPLEGKRWMLTVAGWHGDYPPDDEQGLLDFTRSLPNTDIHRIVSNAKPAGEIITYRFKSSQWRHYETLKRFPHGILPLGDAIASFNPVYGQGMASAALQAKTLDTTLKRCSHQSALQDHYFKGIRRIVSIPWKLATGSDFQFKDTVGNKPPATDLINRYVTKLHRATHTDTFVYLNFLRVVNLERPVTSLMSPRMLWHVLRSR